MNGADTARGRLAISLDLIRDQHGLFSDGCEAGLPGKLGEQVSDPVMSSGVQTFGTASRMSAIGIQKMLALFASRGDSAASLARAWGRIA